MRSDKRTQLIAVEDIGAINAIIFSNRSLYLGRTIEISGDELTEAEKAQVLAKVIGRPVTLVQPQMPDGFTPDEEQLASARFFDGEAYTADIDAIRTIHPGLRNFEQYLRKSGWEDLPVLPLPEGGNAWG